MASFGNSPNPWASSYDTYKDCSQGLCSVYCPQWCYIIFPPPPPFGDFDDALGYDGGGSGSSGTDFSPLIIAVIGILASAFILLSYYTIISKHCRRRRSGDENRETASHNERGREDNNDDGDDSAGQTASFQPHQEGLEEGLIKSIRVYKYRKSDGLVDGTDCAVCLSEFEESQGLRLLPKCNHAFHVPCIDRWLKSHSSCPLCRSNIAPFAAAAAAAAAEDVVLEVVQSSVSSYHSRSNEIGHVVVVVDDGVSREGVREEEERLEVPKIGPLQTDHARPIIRRSASLNCHGFCSDRLSVADILREEEDEDEDEEGDKDLVAQIQNRMQLCLEIGTSSKGGSDDDHDDDDHDHDQHCKWDRSGALGLIRSPLAMRRSISTGRFVFTRHGKGKNFALPN